MTALLLGLAALIPWVVLIAWCSTRDYRWMFPVMICWWIWRTLEHLLGRWVAAAICTCTVLGVCWLTGTAVLWLVPA